MKLSLLPRPQLLAVASVAAFSLSSCVTENPYTGEQQMSKTTSGALGGAAGGAILGAIIGNNVGDGDAGRGALIGAALGGLAGGSIGNYMDQQESMLRRELRASGVSVAAKLACNRASAASMPSSGLIGVIKRTIALSSRP